MTVRMLVAVAVAIVALAGCATRPPPSLPQDADRSMTGRCTRAYAALDAAADEAGVRDVEAMRVAEFPHLRATRFLASYKDENLDDAAFGQWLRPLAAADRDGRRVEIANLPVDVTKRVQTALASEGFAGLAPDALLEGCTAVLLERDLANVSTRARLAERVVVPDDYDTAARAVGLYAVTRIGFATGVRYYERSVRSAFADGPRAPQGRFVVYAPRSEALGTAEVERLLAASMRNPLAVPLVEGADLERLLATYAPTWRVDERTADDRIGRPIWTRDDRPAVEPAPVVFGRAAVGRFAGSAVLQLVYTAWFPARPPAFPGDPLAGRLDGVVWRVTLDRDGAPLVFDSIHACGCFHMFIPTARVLAKPEEPTLDEQALIPLTLPRVAIGERIAVYVESGTHYVRGVEVASATPTGAVLYGIARDDALRTLAHPSGGTRSLFGPDAFVTGTERSERAVFWPLGIARAGAMRQWGHHATAFIGRRHFDEPFLLDRYFLPAH